jgi:hypothetical protein
VTDYQIETVLRLAEKGKRISRVAVAPATIAQYLTWYERDMKRCHRRIRMARKKRRGW